MILKGMIWKFLWIKRMRWIIFVQCMFLTIFSEFNYSEIKAKHIQTQTTSIRCQCVCREPTDISCKNEHMFCKECLNQYFGNNVARKSCPNCQESGLSKRNIRPSGFARRVINALKVKCELECGWKGTLGD